jgi:hypothetical protein
MIFKPTAPSKVLEQQRYEAERMRLEHEAQAELHEAASKSHKEYAAMYIARIQRLDGIQAVEKAKEF